MFNTPFVNSLYNLDQNQKTKIKKLCCVQLEGRLKPQKQYLVLCTTRPLYTLNRNHKIDCNTIAIKPIFSEGQTAILVFQIFYYIFSCY